MTSIEFLLQSVDLYCERVGVSFWAEPLNALSNFGFVAVGCWEYRKNSLDSSRQSQFARFGRWLSLLCVAIGLGSFWFHTSAHYLAQAADLIPIFIFVLLFSWWATQTVFKVSKEAAGFISLLVACLMIGIPALTPSDFLNGSALYIPMWIFLAVLAIGSRKPEAEPYQRVATSSSKTKLRSLWTISVVLFSVSLFFRALDLEVCRLILSGTHFVWHLLNAILLKVLLQIYRLSVSAQVVAIENRKRP